MHKQYDILEVRKFSCTHDYNIHWCVSYTYRQSNVLYVYIEVQARRGLPLVRQLHSLHGIEYQLQTHQSNGHNTHMQVSCM